MERYHSAWFKKTMHLIYIIAVAFVLYSSVALINLEDWETIRSAVSRQMLKFCLAVFATVMAEVFYAWRYDIHPREAFNSVESNGMAFAVFAGLHALGLCILAAYIFSA